MRDAVGGRAAVTAKLNMADGVHGGLWLDESVEVARLLEADGALDALELTGGSSLANPMYLFRGEAPRGSSPPPCPRALRLGFRVVGRRFMRDYPFEEAFFLPYARQFRAALDMPLILLGGINRARHRSSWPLRRGSPSSPWPAPCCASPTSSTDAGRHVDRVAVHPLQQVHAHHLLGHPLCPGGGPSGVAGRPGSA